MQHRTERISEALREELTELVGYELADPRVASATVTGLEVSPDKRHALVLVRVDEGADTQQTIAALEHAAPFLRREVARRRFPIVGTGAGVWSFIHVEDAARATVAALASESPGAYNIVDDEPAPVREWLPALAAALGAPRPLRVPALLARPLAGSYGIATMTQAQGASNARAKQELGWQPSYSSWREGFRRGLD